MLQGSAPIATRNRDFCSSGRCSRMEARADGGFSMAEIVAPRATGESPHLSIETDAFYYLVDGTVEMLLGEEVRTARKGDFVLRPGDTACTPHHRRGRSAAATAQALGPRMCVASVRRANRSEHPATNWPQAARFRPSPVTAAVTATFRRTRAPPAQPEVASTAAVPGFQARRSEPNRRTIERLSQWDAEKQNP